jgi:hypothetical protein
MITQKKEPEFPQAQSTTAQALGLSPHQEITKLDSFESKTILSTQLKIVELVLEKNGCVLAQGWRFNSYTQQHMCRWVNEKENLVVDLFENADRKLKISMHHSREWISPHDSLMPRFAKSIAYAISAAGGLVKYKQSALSKYEKGGHGDA